MRQVWKFPINDADFIEVPEGGRVVHVALQEHSKQICVWIEVDPSTTEIRQRRFRVYGTGWDVPDDAHHVGSILVSGGALVWHVYELI